MVLPAAPTPLAPPPAAVQPTPASPYSPTATPGYAPAGPSYAPAGPSYAPAGPSYASAAPYGAAPAYVPAPQHLAAGPAYAPAAPHAAAAPAPLAVQEAGFFPAVRLVMKTLPFSMFRVSALALGGLLSTLALAALTAATGLLVHFVHPAAGGVIFLVGILAFALVWVSLVERWLFAVDCGYTAVLTELITRGSVGNGEQSQFAYGREVILRRFGDFKAIRECQGHVNYTLNRLFRTVDWLTDWLPFDVEFLTDKLRFLLILSTRHAGQTVLSHGLARGAGDLGQSSVEGLCYYAQNGKEIALSSIGGLVADKILSALCWAVAVAGCGAVIFLGSSAVMPSLLVELGARAGKDAEQAALVASVLITGLLAIPLSILLTWALREAIVRPVLLAMVLLKFHITSHNQPLDPAVKQRLRDVSDKLDALETAQWHTS